MSRFAAIGGAAAMLVVCVPVLCGGPALKRVGSLPSKAFVEDFQFINERTGFLVFGGSAWRTDDGGKSWLELGIPPHRGSILPGAQFLPDGRGWIELDEKRFVTESYGGRWALLSSPVNYPRGIIHSLFFLRDGRRGWAGGGEYQMEATGLDGPAWAIDSRPEGVFVSHPVVFATTDAGTTWCQQALPTQLGYFVDNITFVDGRTGMATVQASVIKTDDGGRNWRPVLAGSAAAPEWLAQDLFVLDSQTAWVSFRWVESLGGFLFRTTDGGQHWKSTQRGMNSPDPGIPPVFPVQMWFWSRTNGIATDNVRHHIYSTRNGGRTWQVLFPHRDVSTFCALDPEHVWVVSADSLFQLINLR